MNTRNTDTYFTTFYVGTIVKWMRKPECYCLANVSRQEAVQKEKKNRNDLNFFLAFIIIFIYVCLLSGIVKFVFFSSFI